MFREIVKGIVRNTSILVFQHLLTISSSIVLMMFLPRYLGPVEFGRLYLAGTIVGIFQIAVNYGGSYLIAKNVSRSRSETAQILADELILRLIISLLSIVAIIVLSYVTGYPQEVRLLLLIVSCSLLFYSVGTTLYACFQGLEVLQYGSSAALIEKFSVAIVCLIAILLGANAVHIALILTAGSVVYVAVMVRKARAIVTTLPHFRWENVGRHLRDGVPYFLFSVFSTIYYKIDTVMLSFMTPEAVVGYYGAAYRFFESLNFPYILSIAIYPVLSRLWKNEQHAHNRTAQKSLEYVVMGGVAITVTTIVFADQIVTIFYGTEDYGPSVLLLQLLSAGLLVLYIDMILGTTLMASDRQRQHMMLSLVAIPINIGLNYLLIPLTQSIMNNGAIGAAIATGVTEVFIMIGILRLLPREVLRSFRFDVVYKSLASGLVMYASIFLLQLAGLPWIVQCVAGVSTYGVSLLLLKTLEPAETRFLLGLIHVRNANDIDRLFSGGAASPPDRSDESPDEKQRR